MTNVGKSSYARKGKKPHRYSDAYHAWVAAGERHGYDSEEAIEADAAFRQRWGVPSVAQSTYY